MVNHIIMIMMIWLAIAMVLVLPTQNFMVSAFSPSHFDLHQPIMHHQHPTSPPISTSTTLYSSSSEDIQAKLKAQMSKLQERDRTSRAISPDVSRKYLS